MSESFDAYASTVKSMAAKEGVKMSGAALRIIQRAFDGRQPAELAARAAASYYDKLDMQRSTLTRSALLRRGARRATS